MLRTAFAFVRRDFQVNISYRFAFLLNLLGILFSVLTFFFIAKLFGERASPYLEKYGGEYFPFVLIGIAFSGYLGVGLSSFAGALRSEQVTGTLEMILLTPTKISTFLISQALWRFLRTSLDVIIYLLMGIFFFKVSALGGLRVSQILPALAVLILTITSFSSLGIMAAGFIMIFKRGDPVTWIFSTLSSLLGGVYYPIAILPGPLQKLSNFLPITYSLKGLRGALLAGDSWMALAPNLIALVLFTLILMPIGILIFRYAIRKAKIDGSLVHY